MPSRALGIAGAVVYALLVFGGTALLGFVVLPPLGYAAGFFAIETDARAAFSLVTLKAVPVLFGLSAAAAVSYEWLMSLSLARRAAMYGVTTVLVWLGGAASAMLALG